MPTYCHLISIFTNCCIYYEDWFVVMTEINPSVMRPPVPILALTPCADIARSLCLVWGVHAVEVEAMDDYENMEIVAVQIATESSFARSGDNLVITAGLPLQTSGSTNIMRLVRIPATDAPRTPTHR